MIRGLSFTLLNCILVCSSFAQFTPLICGSKTDDVSNCQFDGNNCFFYRNFDTLKSVPWHEYNGDPTSADFIIEDGTPSTQNGILYLPLLQTNVAQARATIMSTTRFLNYGSFEASMSSAGHSGVISTFISISNLQDEIDFEFVPKEKKYYNQVQSNWYHRGEPTFNINFADGNANNDTFNNFHIYKVDWTPNKISWSIDGKVFNVLDKSKMGNNSYRFPNTPSRIQFGVWHALNSKDWAGDSTIDWPTVNSNGGLSVRFDWIKILGAGCDESIVRTETTPSATKVIPTNNGIITATQTSDDAHLIIPTNSPFSQPNNRPTSISSSIAHTSSIQDFGVWCLNVMFVCILFV